MPYSVRKKSCKQSDGKKGRFIVIKTNSSKKKSCHNSRSKALGSIAASYANKVMEEIKDYFKKKDKDYLEFDDHPLSSIDDLMNPDKPAPWDHLHNSEGDGDIDIDVRGVSKT